MSEQLKTPQDDYIEQHPNVIEDVELAEFAAYATKGEEEEIRRLGQEALSSLVDGTVAVEDIQKQRLDLRLQADAKIGVVKEKIDVIKELSHEIKQDPSAERSVADMAAADKERFGLFQTEELFKLAKVELIEIAGIIKEKGLGPNTIIEKGSIVRKEDGRESVEFSFDSQQEAEDREDQLVEELNSRIGELVDVDMPEGGFDIKNFLNTMEQNPESVDYKEMDRYLVGTITAALINQKAASGDFRNLEEACDYFAEIGEINMRELYQATKSVYESLDT